MVLSCYSLNVCVPAKFMYRNPNSQSDVIWRWDLWKVTGHEGGALVNGTGTLTIERFPWPLPPCEDTVRCLQPGKGPSPVCADTPVSGFQPPEV